MFSLDGDPPTVTVFACYSKNGREAVQPIAEALADWLRPWLARCTPGNAVFHGTAKRRRTSDMIRADLEAGGIPYETSGGVVDYHALRGSFISNLVSGGASVKTCQTLARHSTPSLTIGVYAKASLHDISGAVEGLPDLTTSRPAREIARATGTDGRINKRLAHNLPTGRDGSCRVLAVLGGDEHESGRSGGPPETLENTAPDASCRPLSSVVREGGLEPPRLAAQEPKSCASASSATLAVSGRGEVRPVSPGAARPPCPVLRPRDLVRGVMERSPILIAPSFPFHARFDPNRPGVAQANPSGLMPLDGTGAHVYIRACE
jgi:hypothetical protein